MVVRVAAVNIFIPEIIGGLIAYYVQHWWQRFNGTSACVGLQNFFLWIMGGMGDCKNVTDSKGFRWWGWIEVAKGRVCSRGPSANGTKRISHGAVTQFHHTVCPATLCRIYNYLVHRAITRIHWSIYIDFHIRTNRRDISAMFSLCRDITQMT